MQGKERHQWKSWVQNDVLGSALDGGTLGRAVLVAWRKKWGYIWSWAWGASQLSNGNSQCTFLYELTGIYHVHFYCNLLFHVHFYSGQVYIFFNSLSKEWAFPYYSLHLSQVTHNIRLIVGAQERFVSWQLNSLINCYVLTLIHTE